MNWGNFHISVKYSFKLIQLWIFCIVITRTKFNTFFVICWFHQTELQQLHAQQAHLQQVAQSVSSLLEQPDSSVPQEEKQRLRAKLDQLQSQHQEKLQSCQDKLRRADALREELAKFVQEHGSLGTWLDQSEQELRLLGEGETDAKGLKCRIEEHKKVQIVTYKMGNQISLSGKLTNTK